MTQDFVWLHGERFDIAYLLEPGRWKVRRFIAHRKPVRPTAGFGQRVNRWGFVGWYVHPRTRDLQLRVAGRDFRFEHLSCARATVKFGGLATRLEILPTGGDRLVVDQRTIRRAVLSRIDPAYDGLDEAMDDFLAEVARLINSNEVQQRVQRTLDPRDGPWELLSTGSRKTWRFQ